MEDFYNPIDFSGIVGYPHDISDDVIENLSDFHDYGDACAHVKAFGQCIDDCYDPRIYEDVLMKLISWTLVDGYACDWFHGSNDNEFKTIQDLCMPFWRYLGMIRMKLTMNRLILLWKNGRRRIF
jgi:hypothetical protein